MASVWAARSSEAASQWFAIDGSVRAELRVSSPLEPSLGRLCSVCMRKWGERSAVVRGSKVLTVLRVRVSGKQRIVCNCKVKVMPSM